MSHTFKIQNSKFKIGLFFKSRIQNLKFKIQNWFVALLCTLYSVLSTPAYSQENYTFNKCLELAIKQNTGYKYDELEFQKAVISQNTMAYNRLPDLNGNVNTSLNNGRALDPLTYNYNTQTFLYNNASLLSSLKLYEGNKLNLQIGKANLYANIQQYKLENTKLNITKDLVSVYADILMQQELIKLWTNRVTVLNQQKEKIQLLVDGGRKTQAAVYEIDIEISKSWQFVDELNYRLAMAQLRLKNILNVPFQEKITTDNSLNAKLKIDTTNNYNNEKLDAIILNTASFKEANLQITLAQKDLRLAKSGYSPSITLNGVLATGYSSKFNATAITETNTFTNQFRNNFFQNVSVNIYVPIFNKFQTKANVNKYKIASLQSNELLSQRTNTLRELVVNQHNQLKFSAKKYFHVQNALTNYEAILDETLLNYNAGKIDLFEYLYKQQQKFTLEQSKIELKYNYLVAQKCLELFEKGTVSWE